MYKNLKKELGDYQTFLVNVNSRDYNHIIVKITKELAKTEKVCFVNLNKNFYSLIRLLQKNNVNLDNMFFIDAISGEIKDEDKIGNAVFLYSPNSLTSIGISVSRVLKENFDYLVFDSVSSLEAHSDLKLVSKFICYLVDKICSSKTKALFINSNFFKNDSLISELNTELDKVIDIEKIKDSPTHTGASVVATLVGLGFVSLLGSDITGAYIGPTNSSYLPYAELILGVLISFLYMTYKFSFNPKPITLPKGFRKLKLKIMTDLKKRGVTIKKKVK